MKLQGESMLELEYHSETVRAYLTSSNLRLVVLLVCEHGQQDLLGPEAMYDTFRFKMIIHSRKEISNLKPILNTGLNYPAISDQLFLWMQAISGQLSTTLRIGSQFKSDFYKQIAVNAGLSLQLDVFLLLRFDLAFKLRNPYKNDFGKYWDNNSFKPTFVFSINNPF